MRLGILADIHEQLDPLRRALEAFQELETDRIVVLGDTFDGFGDLGHAAAVADLLARPDVVGVWGNHDMGLCYRVNETARRLYDPAVLDFMSRMQPWLIIEDCYFSQVEPWLDPFKVEDMWHFEGPPDTPSAVRRSFAAVRQRHVFMGHYHRWLVMTPDEPVDWHGEGPLHLDHAARYLVAVASVLHGACAIFDTDRQILFPLRC